MPQVLPHLSPHGGCCHGSPFCTFPHPARRPGGRSRPPGAGRAWAGAGSAAAAGADRAGAAGPAGRCGVRIMRHAANTDRGADPMCAPPPRLAVRHVPVGDHLPCSSAPGTGAGRRPGRRTPCFGLRRAGGGVGFNSGAQFAAAAFLPLCPSCRIQKSPSTQELLEDRFSLPYLFLSGYCAGPW